MVSDVIFCNFAPLKIKLVGINNPTTMTKKEREELASICEDIQNGDEQTDALVRLYDAVKRIIQN